MPPTIEGLVTEILREAQSREQSDMTDPTREFSEFLRQKSIAVVGPARTLIGSKLGPDIDSHDIVVRFNDVFEHLPFPNHLARDIGTRSDIIYCNQVVLRKNILDRAFAQGRYAKIFNDAGVKYFVCTNNSLNFTASGKSAENCPQRDKNTVARFSDFLLKHRSKTRFRLLHRTSEMLIRWLDGNFGRTGFIAILDLLCFGIRRLSIFGMTFYHGGGHLFAPSNIELHPLKNRDGTWARDDSGLGHNSYLELEIMKLLLRAFPEKINTREDLSSFQYKLESISKP